MLTWLRSAACARPASYIVPFIPCPPRPRVRILLLSDVVCLLYAHSPLEVNESTPPLPPQNGETPIDVARNLGHADLVVWLEHAQQMKARVRRLWLTAKALATVYPYAIFWYCYVGKQLCAPGGKWAKRDRAAFVHEFGEVNY